MVVRRISQLLTCVAEGEARRDPRSSGWSDKLAVAGRATLVPGIWAMACAPAHALGYEDFTLNWLTSGGELVSLDKKREIPGSMKRDPKTNHVSSVAFVFQIPDGRDSSQ